MDASTPSPHLKTLESFRSTRICVIPPKMLRQPFSHEKVNARTPKNPVNFDLAREILRSTSRNSRSDSRTLRSASHS
jgi:hypothetical protein